MDFSEKYPRAVQSILDNHYVDDLLDSTDTVEEAIKLAKDIKFIHQAGGFNIRNWISNSNEVINALGESFTEKKSLNLQSSTATEKVLGLSWCTKTDTFNFKSAQNRINHDLLSGVKIPTKRDILRFVMMVFDPLGLLGYFMIYAKILLQHIWIEKLEWDEPIPPNLFKNWLFWIKHFEQIEEIEIPRCYTSKFLYSPESTVELHVFVDAGKDAYAAAAYISPKRSRC